jgi:hypothetical protein
LPVRRIVVVLAHDPPVFAQETLYLFDESLVMCLQRATGCQTTDPTGAPQLPTMSDMALWLRLNRPLNAGFEDHEIKDEDHDQPHSCA